MRTILLHYVEYLVDRYCVSMATPGGFDSLVDEFLKTSHDKF